jgi:hypothetical protein
MAFGPMPCGARRSLSVHCGSLRWHSRAAKLTKRRRDAFQRVTVYDEFKRNAYSSPIWM